MYTGRPGSGGRSYWGFLGEDGPSSRRAAAQRPDCPTRKIAGGISLQAPGVPV